MGAQAGYQSLKTIDKLIRHLRLKGIEARGYRRLLGSQCPGKPAVVNLNQCRAFYLLL